MKTIVILVALSLGLAACGVRGPLEPPPSSTQQAQ